jgi:Flp pilus assembly protein TadG
MVKTNSGTQGRKGFMSRLRHDQSGNVIAILAAAVIPVIGLVGGAVDMSRVYLVQARAQAACDAGSLMGRKVMANGLWSDNTNRANTEAVRAFNANFQAGSYGTGALTRSFTETSGKVTGTASVVVPMTLMKVFGQGDRTIAVTCSSEMRIPNSDVMFVLDTTGSMDSAPNGNSVSSSNPAKITELRKATKCFYEVLTQKNITDVTAAQCGETADPVETASNTSQIRFGFVPYSINVNVGKLLPLDYMANSWQYQTRRANWIVDPDNSYTLGSLSALTQVGSPSTTTSGGSWQGMANNVSINGNTYLKTVQVNRAPLNCNTISWPPTQTTGPTVNGPNQVGAAPTPVYPATSITLNYNTTSTSGSTQYRYVADNPNVNSNKKCYLERLTSSSVTTTQQTATRSVTWIPAQVFNNWTYDKLQVNVSALKNTPNNRWNNSLVLPVGNSGTNATIAWDGCILERPTQKNVTDWDTSATSAAKDMAIDLIPTTSDPTTQWGPRLNGLQYARTSGGNWTQNTVTSTSNMSAPTSGNTTTACPSESRLLDVWDPTDYRNYINGLTTDGYTFHDIGMLWGARLISPTGIFASHNATANDNVQRHMIFMTDGDTNANPDSLSAYGVPWFDRLQTNSGSAPTASQLNTITDQRTAALCTAVKNMNITLWVISYGADVNSSTNDRLEECATDGRFFAYDPNVSLTSQFKQIAGQIAALRLTN